MGSPLVPRSAFTFQECTYSSPAFGLIGLGEIALLADEQLDMQIGVAFVDANGEPGWIRKNPSISKSTIRPCAAAGRRCNDLRLEELGNRQE